MTHYEPPANLADLYSRLDQPNNAHWDIIDPMRPVHPMVDVVPSPIPIPIIEGASKTQQLIDEHLVPRLIQLLQQFKENLKCGTYFVKSPNWIEPPATAFAIDRFTNGAVTVPILSQATVIDFTVPDRHVAVVNAFGMELGEFNQWGDITFSILVNGQSVREYASFVAQLGRFVEPTRMGSPIMLKHRDRFTVLASNTSDDPVDVFFRVMGFMMPVETVSDDGSMNQFHDL